MFLLIPKVRLDNHCRFGDDHCPSTHKELNTLILRSKLPIQTSTSFVFVAWLRPPKHHYKLNLANYKEILEEAVPITKQDVVLVFCEVDGWREGLFEQEADVRKIYNLTLFDEHWSSIQITTAASLCTILDLNYEGKLPATGFVKQEDVNYDDFINNRFGRYYQT